MSTFFLKRNDTSPSIVYDLSMSDGPVDLTGATVRFYMGKVVDSEADVLDAEAGRVEYVWQEGDSSRSGLYRAEWEVVFADGTKQTFPNDSYIRVRVVPDLGEPDA